jgi:6-phosphogluconolactonase (cycloisomerase 2 family)
VFATAPGSTTATLTGNNCASSNAPCPYWLSRIPTALSVLTFTPPNGGTTQTLLFVTSNKDLTATHNDNQLSVFAVDSSGNLTEASASPYTTQPNPRVVLAVNTNRAPLTTGGVFVYVGSQGSVSGSVSVFQVCTVVGSQGNGNVCTPQEVQDNQLLPVGTPSAAGKSPVAMVVDPTNNFLYVASGGSNQVFAFQIATGAGTLSPLAPASLPSQGSSPAALVMHPSSNTSNQFLFVSNNTSNTIGGFTVGVTSGNLSTSPTSTLFTPGMPSGMAAK